MSGLSMYKTLYTIPEEYPFNVHSLSTCQGLPCPCTLPINTVTTLTALAGSGTPPYTYHWSITKPNGTIDTSPTSSYLSYNFSQVGNYSISVYVTDSTSKTSNIDSCTINITSGGGGCTPNWQCIQPLNGYEHDINNCPGSVDRLNSACNPGGGGCTTPKYKCSGTSCISDNCDGTGIYTTSTCNNACSIGCTPNWQCIQPFNGYEHDINNCPGSVDKLNSACNPGVSGCTNCDLRTNYCITGVCVPRKYVLYGGIGFGAILLLTILK